MHIYKQQLLHCDKYSVIIQPGRSCDLGYPRCITKHADVAKMHDHRTGGLPTTANMEMAALGKRNADSGARPGKVGVKCVILAIKLTTHVGDNKGGGLQTCNCNSSDLITCLSYVNVVKTCMWDLRANWNQTRSTPREWNGVRAS